jgi:hypothetical protein
MNYNEFNTIKSIASRLVKAGWSVREAIVLAKAERKVSKILGLSCALILSCVGLSHAGELYVTGGVGASIVSGLPENGTWYQDGMASEKDRLSIGYKAGLGYRWSNWYVEGNHVAFGQIENVGHFVGDHDYDTQAARCIKCDDVSSGRIRGNTQRGLELVVGYTWNEGGLIRPRVHAGGYAAKHSTSFEANYPSVGGAQQHTYKGTVMGLTGGAGVCIAWVCGDVNYYHAIAHTQYPFARGVVMPTLTVNIPLTSW